jgi:D-arabinose 1-dehydrogenase-like Zn-dependent alcohol dehydrogenase
MGSPDWRGDETLDPDWHILSERVQGTLADYVVVPRRNAIPRPPGISAVDASVLGTAWLTAYRMLFTKSGLRAGENDAGCKVPQAAYPRRSSNWDEPQASRFG